MPRLSFSVLGALLIATLSASPAGSAASSRPAPQDFVLASGGAASIFRNISIDVHSDATGRNPSGTVSFQVVLQPGVATISGPVTCLTVDHNRAVIGFDDTSVGLGGITVMVVDNGPTGSPPDEFAATPFPTDCSAFSIADLLSPLSTGDIRVYDAPTLKQCQHGGWRSYTDTAGQPFGNQGACVAFAQGRG